MIAQFSVLALDVLLLSTLIYLFILMRKLKTFNTYRNDMRAIVSDVITATESAREAVARLKSSVIDSQNSMSQYFEDARQIEQAIDKRVADANEILKQLQIPPDSKFQERASISGSVEDPSIKRETRPSQRSNAVNNSHAIAQALRGNSKSAPVAMADEASEHDIHRRLASISESVSQLRSKLVAHS